MALIWLAARNIYDENVVQYAQDVVGMSCRSQYVELIVPFWDSALFRVRVSFKIQKLYTHDCQKTIHSNSSCTSNKGL